MRAYNHCSIIRPWQLANWRELVLSQDDLDYGLYLQEPKLFTEASVHASTERAVSERLQAVLRSLRQVSIRVELFWVREDLIFASVWQVH